MNSIIGVGPVRSGTTWLDAILRIHPEMLMSHKVKELDFFSLKFEKGLSWYGTNFEQLGQGVRAWGDISPSYIAKLEYADRIKSLLPQAKIIINLRNLYDLTLSMYGLYLRYGGKNIGLYEAVRSGELDKKISFGLNISRLSDHVKKYCDVFGKENIFFIIHDDLVASPSELAQRVYNFIGIDDTFSSPLIEKPYNSMIMPNSRLLAKVAATTQGYLRRFELHGIANKLKAIPALTHLVYDKNARPEYRDKDKAFQYLKPFFDEEIDNLSEIVGISLHHWKVPKGGV
jgi:hypothetical protein